MQRRKFLATVGSLTAASAAGIGTGAFTTASVEDRTVTVAIDEDDESQIALIPNDDHPGIEINDDGELEIDLTGDSGEGVNINSTYTWGDPDDPENDYAFKIANATSQEYDDLILSYELDDDSWVDNSTTYDNESFIRFDTFGQGDPDGYWGSIKCPNNQLSTPNPVSRNMPTSGPVDFEAGQEIYVVIDVDTTGVLATLDDDLSGKLTIEVDGPGGN